MRRHSRALASIADIADIVRNDRDRSIREAYEAGLSAVEIANATGLHRVTIHAILRDDDERTTDDNS